MDRTICKEKPFSIPGPIQELARKPVNNWRFVYGISTSSSSLPAIVSMLELMIPFAFLPMLVVVVVMMMAATPRSGGSLFPPVSAARYGP